MAYTIVHCADVHLETTFTLGGARRRAALADAFVRIVDHAIALRADALTIGGDLFESERAGPQTARFLVAQLGRFPGRVFIAPGNHDPFAGTTLLGQWELPANTHVFSDPMWQAVPLAEGVTLFGFGHSAAEPGRPFAAARFDRDGIQIAIVHGSDEERCPPKKRATAPFTLDEIKASGITCVLTGHYHAGYTLESNGAPLLAYPGSPEPMKFGEDGAHGAIVLRIDRGRLRLERFPTARTRLLERICSLEGVGDDHALRAAIERALEGFTRDDYVRLKLTGAVQPGVRIEKASIIEDHATTLGALQLEDATVAHDYERVAQEPTVRGRVVRELLQARRSPDVRAAADAERALHIALAAFDGLEVAP